MADLAQTTALPQEGEETATGTADHIEGFVGPNLDNKTSNDAGSYKDSDHLEGSGAQSDDGDAGQGKQGLEILLRPSAVAAASKDAPISFVSLSRKDIWSAISARAEQWQIVKSAADALGVSPVFVSIAAVLGALGFLLFGIGGSLLCTVVGALYPAFESFKAVETRDMEVTRFWMTYWVVYALMSSIDCACSPVLVYIPFYYPVKLTALMFLCSRSTGGPRYVYTWCVAPILGSYRQEIDGALEQSRESINHGLKLAAARTLETGVATGYMGMSSLKKGISGAGSSMGSMARMAFMLARSRKSSSSSALRVATSCAEDAILETTSFASVSCGSGPQKDEPAGEGLQDKTTSNLGGDDAHGKEGASREGDTVADNLPRLCGLEVAAKRAV